MAQIKEIKYLFEELYAPLLLSERGRIAGLAVLALLSLLLVYILGANVVGWYGDWKTKPVTPTEIRSASDSSESQLITDLPKQHLLGQAAGDDDFLPITSLQLHLTGILKDTSDKRSKVIVSEGGQPGKVYKVGDSLTAGIVINAINDDGIVLEHGGRLEKLPLTRLALKFEEAPKTLWAEN